jgi:cell division septum initiation protein DivIVA
MEQIVEVVLKDGPLEAYLQRCQQEYQKQEEANQQLVGIRKQIEVTEYRLENLLNASANDLLSPEAIRDKYGRRNRLSELKKRQDTQPIALDRFRQLLKEELEQEESRKSALHALIERIAAYPDRKMEVKFRIGERVEPVQIVTPS